MPAPSPDSARQHLLAEALELSRSLLQGMSHAVDPDRLTRQCHRLQQIQHELRAFAHPIQRDRLPISDIPLEVRRAFVEAVILVTRYPDLGGRRWQGTLPSPTLSQYQAGPLPTDWRQSDAIARRSEQFLLPPGSTAELESMLAWVDGQIEQQRQIMAAVLSPLTMAPDDPANIAKPALLELFQHLFGPIPLPPDSLDCVYTDLQLYFCLNYKDDRLYQRIPDWHHQVIPWERLPPADCSAIQDFLRSLEQFSFDKFNRFPIFGACDATLIDPDWCDRIAAAVGCSTATVITTLLRSVSIIPTQKAEAFLVHDVWGHHWQFTLSQFESDYSILADCDEPLRAAETAYTPDGPLTCQELFQREGDRVWVDEERSLLFFHAEVQQRLGLLFTHILGEMLADVAEFKFIWDHPDGADQLPSSSLFKTQPTKLDLSLADLDFLFLRVLKPLLEVHLSALEESSLESELLARWEVAHLPSSLEVRTRLKGAIAHLYQIFLEAYNATYLPTLTGEVGLFTHIASNLLYLQNAVSDLYTDPIVKAHPDLPFQDLLLVFISRYCSSDCYREFWDIDDAIAQYFFPCWYQLTAPRNY